MPSFPEAVRGEAAPAPPLVLRVRAGQHVLYLPPPPLPDVPADQAVTLEVRTPSDSLLCTLTTTLGDVSRCRAMPVDAGSWSWSPGTYHLLARPAPAPGAVATALRFAFRVELTGE